MSYLVLARKWRPRDFSQVVGQGHVLRALANALDTGRLHHAYLFIGTRGVGKTTLARVFAKCLNCEVGVSSQPCGQCSACREMDEGRFLDLIEVDAASRTKVDETRDLLDNVQYAPTKGRYKVYLIDEVHMFSQHSFNALLKTLEEPPPHVKFLLATTEPRKLPITVLSRCLQLGLKRLSVEQIFEQLRRVSGQEGLTAEDSALRLLAEAADGSMRDALSLLDQSIAFCGGAVEEQSVASMLGTLGSEQVVALLERLAADDGPGLIALARQLAELGPDFTQVLAGMLSLLRRVAVVQTVGSASAELAEEPVIERLAAQFTPQECQLYYQMGLLARRDLPLAPDPQAGFEMALLRMLAYRPQGEVAAAQAGERRTAGAAARPVPPPRPQPASSPAGRPQSPPDAPSVAAPARPTPETQPQLPQPATPAVERPLSPPPAPPATTAPREPSPPAHTPSAAGALDWPALVAGLQAPPLARELARNCAVRQSGGQVIELAVSPQFENLRVERTIRQLEQAVSQALGRDISLRVSVDGSAALETPAAQLSAAEAARHAAARDAIDADPNIQAMQRQFGARVERVDPGNGSSH